MTGRDLTAAEISAFDAALMASVDVVAGLPVQPSEAMLTAGARTIGGTMGEINQRERARLVYAAMARVFLEPSDLPPVPKARGA